MGFDSPTQNSLDGVASRDYLLEILSELSIFSNGLSRLAHDLYLWSTSEFSYIEVGNSVAICSSIMPQKKNPYTLEHIKAKAAHVQAALVSCLGSLKNTPFTHSCDVCLESPRYFWDAVYEVEASISIMIATIKTVKVNKELMLQRALKNFSTVTELANLLVREAGLSFTEAHRVVASLVNDLLQQDQTPEYIDLQKLSQFALDLLGKEIHLSEVQLRQALHPVTNVQLKSVKGGPSPKEVLSQLEGLSEQLKSDKYELGEKVDQIEDTRGLLKEKADQMLKC
ncbi:lyase family protein [Ammoniphilus sp. 3BR4]